MANEELGQVQPNVPENLVYFGLGVGLLLVFVGISFLAFGEGSLLSSLMTCVGFGIVLATFGSKAGGTWAGWSATGAGAMSIILFLFCNNSHPHLRWRPQSEGKYGEIFQK
jgi:hypothetical protein